MVSITVFQSSFHVMVKVVAAFAEIGTLVNRLNTKINNNRILTGFLIFAIIFFPPF